MSTESSSQEAQESQEGQEGRTDPEAADGPSINPPAGTGLQKALVVLVALLAIGVTALVALSVIKQNRQTASQQGKQQPGDPGATMIDPAGRTPAGQTPDGDPGTLPVLRKLEPFTMTERSGETVSLADMKGKVWVAGFIFTRCPGMCPAVSMQMKALRDRVNKTVTKTAGWGDFRLMSLSVEPDFDTPEVLTRYAKQYEASGRWLFVTGPRQAMWQTIRTNFLLAVEEAKDENAAEPIIHSPNLVLIDRQGQIRGYYNALDADARKKLWTDLIGLLASRTEPVNQATQKAIKTE